jgi:phosphoesterase RecJ-like protein
VAQCLLCGLVTDTLCFRTNNTRAETLGKAQQLMAAGADLSQIVQYTLGRMATSTLYLWANVMPNIKLEDNVIWASITRQAKKAAAAAARTYGDVRDGALSSLLVQAEDAEIAAVFTEREDGKVEISLRARPGIDLAPVAVALGGGGHKLASGATMQGTLEEIEARVIPMLKQLVKDRAAASPRA